jgi:hypothetical protein
MATRTVRLDEEAEATLKQIRDATGLPISEAFKRGLRALQEQIAQTRTRTPWEIYSELDLGPGGYAIAPAEESRRGVLEAIRKKTNR